MKRLALIAVAFVVTFFGAFEVADCQNCDRGRAMIAFSFVGSAQAAPTPKQIIIPCFGQGRKMVFEQYIEYATDTMKVGLDSKLPSIAFAAGKVIPGAGSRSWGKQLLYTTGVVDKSGWILLVPTNVRLTRFSVKAITPESFRPGEEGVVLWYKTWKANLPINDGISEWTSPEKEMC